MKTVAVCMTPHEGDLLLSRLQHEGLRVCLIDGFASALGGAGGVCAVKVMMHEDDIPRFRDLVEEDAGLRHLLRLDQHCCPRCGSYHVRLMHGRTGLLESLVDLLFGLFRLRPSQADHLRCQKCGYNAPPQRFQPPDA